MAGDSAFAPTYFAPISAIARDTWMSARVSFADLDRAVDPADSMAPKWLAFRGNREGEVTFSYAVLHCLRPWFTPPLYRADDWRLRDGALASQGNGSEGWIPAYVDAVYLVSVKDVNVRAQPSPPIFIPGRPATLALEQPRFASPTLSATSIKSMSPHGDGVRFGVVPGTAAPAAWKAPIGSAASSAPAEPMPASGAPSPRLLSPSADMSVYAPARLGILRRVSKVDMDLRLRLTQLLVSRPGPAPAPPPQDSSIYVAGFGCECIPHAPNPNVHYGWT